MFILGVETSCDETSASVLSGTGQKIKILSNVVASQIEIHKKYNGVVPEIAAREHVLNIIPVINEALVKAKTSYKKIDFLAVTIGPGLITSLIPGIEATRSLSYAWNVPVIPINHIEGHIYSSFINISNQNVFPALILIVSGGHTTIVLMKNHGKYKIVGETRDDAAGEAFDKAAKMLGLGYPGGPIISEKARIFQERGKKSTLSLPRPMINSNDFDFSFSGLKTALLYQLKKDLNWHNRVEEYCYEVQQAIIDVLIIKTMKAAIKNKVKTVVLCGGVSANKKLRLDLQEKVENELNLPFFVPEFQYTTDNAAMIASAAYFKVKNKVNFKKNTDWQKLKANSSLDLC
ncbi:MAG: tRNA (adenosine(37)-N6)-threonylcarbamoyltransferase complex transferase subunit TsaD [Planctomycetes bacterium]|jgi:N6-L-threonylcarbamoyladenine synthase|nr:tRNA (adenosine(37)-N6)-threonylcarbamoyltransferase complex transferase subunit TsaD [Planctomycetota bacterium]